MRIDRSQLLRGGIVLGVVLVFALALWGPTVRQIMKLNEQIAQSTEHLDLARDRAGSLTALAREVQDLQTRIDGTNKQVPEYSKLPELLRELSQQIEHEQLTGQGMSTASATKYRDYIAMPVELSFVGDGASAFRFVNRLEQMEKMMQIQSLSLRNESRSTQPEIKATVNVDTYFYEDRGGGR